jgi:type IV pilus assembly protein PilA
MRQGGVMTVKTKCSNQHGFTLIELMIVIAIIGILSAIGIPIYKQHQVTARQVEAKINLSAAYTVETAYKIKAASHTSCLGKIGLSLPGLERYYTVGFGSGTVSRDAACSPSGEKTSCLAYKWNDDGTVATDGKCEAKDTYFAATIAEGADPLTDSPHGIVDTDISWTAFVIAAVGAVGGSAKNTGKKVNDCWTVNEKKELKSVDCK